VRILLVSTYDLGRQPLGLASPAAWLREAGADVDCVDTSRDPLTDERIREASLVAFYLPMHTATRLAGPLIDRVRRTHPAATIAAYGLYAPLNVAWLHERGVTHVLGAEAEADLVALANGELPISNSQLPTSNSGLPTQVTRVPSLGSRVPIPEPRIPRLAFIRPDRSTLPPLQRYAALQMPDGTRRVVGSTEATRGCKHLCRHCPIVPVYRGLFRAIPLDVVLADIRAQLAAGAEHISFGDADFFNGPRHAQRLVERLAAEWPGLTYDVTIKIEHLLQHADLLPLLRDTGCLFVTSAVESIDDGVLERLRKGHSRADFVRAVERCRGAGVTLSPTFVPFTPWTTVGGYVELLEQLDDLALVDAIAPIQLAIRLLVTAESALLELPDLRDALDPFDAASLTWPWRHADAGVDALQRDVMAVVGSRQPASRAAVFDEIVRIARDRAGAPRRRTPPPASCAAACCSAPASVPHLTEAWYCCAEPAGCDGSGTPATEHDDAAYASQPAAPSSWQPGP
jgi:radical SAM superfamily enzyme YgiQ (UPF0313 family)